MSALSKLWCWLVGHRLEVWQYLGPYSRRVVCDHCGGDWGMNDDVRAIVRWDEDLAECYRNMGYRIRARHSQRTGE